MQRLMHHQLSSSAHILLQDLQAPLSSPPATKSPQCSTRSPPRDGGSWRQEQPWRAGLLQAKGLPPPTPPLPLLPSVPVRVQAPVSHHLASGVTYNLDTRIVHWWYEGPYPESGQPGQERLQDAKLGDTLSDKSGNQATLVDVAEDGRLCLSFSMAGQSMSTSMMLEAKKVFTVHLSDVGKDALAFNDPSCTHWSTNSGVHTRALAAAATAAGGSAAAEAMDHTSPHAAASSKAVPPSFVGSSGIAAEAGDAAASAASGDAAASGDGAASLRAACGGRAAGAGAVSSVGAVSSTRPARPSHMAGSDDSDGSESSSLSGATEDPSGGQVSSGVAADAVSALDNFLKPLENSGDMTAGIADTHSEVACNDTQQRVEWQRLVDSVQDIWKSGTFTVAISELIMPEDSEPARWHMHMHVSLSMHIHVCTVLAHAECTCTCDMRHRTCTL